MIYRALPGPLYLELTLPISPFSTNDKDITRGRAEETGIWFHLREMLLLQQAEHLEPVIWTGFGEGVSFISFSHPTFRI